MRGKLNLVLFAFLLLLILWGLADRGAGTEWVVEGYVFHDADADGTYGQGERGLAGVPVSNGRDVVATAPDGSYQLSLGNDRRIIFITTPSGWWTGSFYRHLQPETGQEVNFPLYPVAEPEEFAFVQVSDIHIIPQAVEAVEEFVTRVNYRDPLPAFVISTGDLVFDVCYLTKQADTLDEVEAAFGLYQEAISGLTPPLFNVIGNHDCACALPADLPEYYKGAYQKFFGPLWYSFDFGGWHFVILDGNSPEPLPRNWLTDEELEWLQWDLKFQPRDRPIVLLSHQPLFYCRNYDKLLNIVKGYDIKVALSGHEHATYTREAGIINLVTGALSGRWWGDDGVHWNGRNTDGSPQGFRLCQVNGAEFSSEYVKMESQPK